MKTISKADIILLVIIIAACLGFIVILKHNSNPGLSVRIMVDGELINSFNINDDVKSKVITNTGENIVIIKNGEVYVSEADCPDKICVNHKPISDVGETIICLPHKLVIEIDE